MLQHRQTYRLALPDHHTPGTGVPNQEGTLPRPPGHPQRKPTGGLHRVLEFPDGRRHGGSGGRTHLATSITALTKAVQAMARREGAPLEWTANTLVEQRIHHNANKTQQTGRQVHPPLWDKDRNLQPHSPWMVHFVLEDHIANRKGTEVQLTHNLAHTHLQYTIPTSNALVTYSTTQQSTHGLRPDTEGTAHTVYTWAQYNDLPGPTWHPNPAWHQPLHGKRVPRQSGTKPAGSTAQGDGTAPANIVNSALANARMPLIDKGHPIPDAHTATHLHRLMHNQEPEVREVFTLTLREAQHRRNTCPQYILHQRGLPTTVGTRIWNHLQLLLPHHRHVIQTNHKCEETGPIAVLHTDVGGGPTGDTTTLDQVGTTLHLVRVTPNQMRAL